MNPLVKLILRIVYFLRGLYFRMLPRKVGRYGRVKLRQSDGILQLSQTLPVAPLSWTCWRLRWLMLGNDVYGDCVFAAIAHAIMAVGAALKHPFKFTRSAVVAGYLAWNKGQDNGVDIDQFLEAWQATSAGEAPFGAGGPFVKIDPQNIAQVKSAIATFGWVLFGVNLQQAQENQFNQGQIWEYVPGSPVVGGHGIFAGGYDRWNVGPYVVSWGKGFRASWGFITNCADEAYTGILPPHVAAGTANELLAYVKGLPAA